MSRENALYFAAGFTCCIVFILIGTLLTGIGWAVAMALITVTITFIECLKPGTLKRAKDWIVANQERWKGRWAEIDRLLSS